MTLICHDKRRITSFLLWYSSFAQVMICRWGRSGCYPKCTYIYMYVMFVQSSAVIPTELSQSMHECLMKLIILPPPFSSVAMATLRSIKMEITTPGIVRSKHTGQHDVKLTLQTHLSVPLQAACITVQSFWSRTWTMSKRSRSTFFFCHQNSSDEWI